MGPWGYAWVREAVEAARNAVDRAEWKRRALTAESVVHRQEREIDGFDGELHQEKVNRLVVIGGDQGWSGVVGGIQG